MTTTPDERAADAIDPHTNPHLNEMRYAPRDLAERVAAAVRDAVSVERERCQAVCEQLSAECNLKDRGELFGYNRLQRAVGRIRAGGEQQ